MPSSLDRITSSLLPRTPPPNSPMPKSTHLFSALSFTVILIYCCITIDTNAAPPLDLSTVPETSLPRRMAVHERFQSSSSYSDGVDDDEDADDGPDPVVSSAENTPKKRKAWFRDNRSKFKILKSDERSRDYESRVNAFFNGGTRRCDYRFFMTWISPVSSFGPRESLALESILKAHPFGCVLFLSRTMDSRHGRRLMDPYVRMGFSVAAVTPDLPLLFHGTPAAAWLSDLEDGRVDPGTVPLMQNLSNLMRLAFLYKHGGAYLDTDVVVVRDFFGLRNAIGAQSARRDGMWTRLNNAVLIFDQGHPLVLAFLEEFARSFNGNRWGYNGPLMVSRVVQRVIKEPSMMKVDCNLTVMPVSAFYPVDWNRIGKYFRATGSEGSAGDDVGEMQRWMEEESEKLRTKSYAVHLWNKLSRRLEVEEGSLMQRLMADHCLLCDEKLAGRLRRRV